MALKKIASQRLQPQISSSHFVRRRDLLARFENYIPTAFVPARERWTGHGRGNCNSKSRRLLTNSKSRRLLGLVREANCVDLYLVSTASTALAGRDYAPASPGPRADRKAGARAEASVVASDTHKAVREPRSPAVSSSCGYIWPRGHTSPPRVRIGDRLLCHAQQAIRELS